MDSPLVPCCLSVRPAILTGLGGSALQGIPVVVPIACESQMAAITRPSGYFRKAERRAAGSARCGGGIRAAPEANGRERRPEGSAPQPHESRPWRESTAAPAMRRLPGSPHHRPRAHRRRGANCPWKSGRRPLCTHQKLGALGKPWLTGNGFHTEGLTSPILANGAFPLLTRIVQVLVSLEVLVNGRSCGPREPTLSSNAGSQTTLRDGLLPRRGDVV